jgi:hypothetical protein
MHTYIHTCKHTYIRTYVPTHTHTHTHTHAHTHSYTVLVSECRHLTGTLMFGSESCNPKRRAESLQNLASCFIKVSRICHWRSDTVPAHAQWETLVESSDSGRHLLNKWKTKWFQKRINGMGKCCGGTRQGILQLVLSCGAELITKEEWDEGCSEQRKENNKRLNVIIKMKIEIRSREERNN